MVLLESIDLPIGSEAEDFSLKGIDGKVYSLESFKAAKGLVIVFMCNHCPYVQAIWGRLVKLQEEFKNKGIQFVGINPNTASPEYKEETMEKMKEYAGEYEMNFPYLEDGEQEVSRDYQAQCTPDIYVYNENRELFYHGRVDDNWKEESEVTKRELKEALEAMLNGESYDDQHPSIGCSIKWVD